MLLGLRQERDKYTFTDDVAKQKLCETYDTFNWPLGKALLHAYYKRTVMLAAIGYERDNLSTEDRCRRIIKYETYIMHKLQKAKKIHAQDKIDYKAILR